MKYIRTKDGRIAEIKENMVVKVSDDATRLVYKEKLYSCVLNGDDDILKQADTIEELCDELVIYNPTIDENFDNQRFVYRNKWDTILNERMAQFQKKYNIETYGSIWIKTHKNAWRLEPVAKMNEEGKLELL